jgi:hypothetical protein
MSKLKAKKPTTVEKRLKALFYGSAGSGKTTASINFPEVYLIDTEKGAENDSYVKLLEQGGGAILQTSDFDEIIEQIIALSSEKHDYKTLVIDPLTIVYHNLLDKAARDRISDKDPDGTAFGGHYNVVNKKMKQLLTLLTRLDMNVIVTCHAKTEYGTNLSVIGSTFDGYKKLDYLFDLVFEIQKRGKDRVALVKKTRVENFPEGEVFPFSYSEVATRYGREVLERDAVVEALAMPEEVTELKELIELFHVGHEQLEKWLDKCDANTIEELSQVNIHKIINHLKSKINKGDTK